MPPSLLKIVIVDDERLAREELRFLLEETRDVEVVAEGANGIEAVELIRSHNPDVVFLDVQMPGLDGFAVLKKLLARKDPRIPQVIFATAFDQYAVRAFEVNAVDYLLKPFDQARVGKALEKVRQRLAGDGTASGETDTRFAALIRLLEQQQQTPQRERTGKLVVRAQSRMLLVDQKDICFASIDEGTISVSTTTIEGKSNCRTLEELLDLLDPEIFWRAHRSFVVNINHIREVLPWFKSSYQLRMDDRKQTELPVSRAQTKRLRELFNL
ncbi:MAG TPA: response regulator transcription factor [Acidobacteriaceae bacterium]|nr:response regulator transcription factor [Acidobacteriaceae bacterium]